MLFIKLKNKYSGFGIIELLIVIGLIGLALAGISGFGNYILKVNSRLSREMAAAYLAQEELEAARAVKDGSWSSLVAMAAGSAYHPVKSGGLWTLAAGSEVINGYTRQVVLSNVSRDANDDIVLSGGADDPGTKKIVATVSWDDQGQNLQTVLTTYLTNWKP